MERVQAPPHCGSVSPTPCALCLGLEEKKVLGKRVGENSVLQVAGLGEALLLFPGMGTYRRPHGLNLETKSFWIRRVLALCRFHLRT